MKMKFAGKSAASMKNLFVVIMTFAMASIVINLQSVQYIDTGGSHVMPPSQIELALVEGSDVRGFGRSLNQHPDVQSKEPETDVKQTLLLKLTQIEERLRHHVTNPPLAIVSNHDNVNDVSSVTLNDLKLKVIRTDDAGRWRTNGILTQGNWSVMFCSDSDTCPTDHVELSQKADVIPALEPFVNNPSKLCDIAKDVHRTEAKKPCLKPDESIDTTGSAASKWWMDNGRQGHVKVGSHRDSAESDMVNWRLPTFPVVYDAGPLLRLRCLVTSLLPLRLHVSSVMETGPYKALEDNTEFKQTRLGDVLQSISERYGLGTSSHWWAAVQDTVLKYLVHVEHAVNTMARRCRRCFQVLYMDLVCQSISLCNIIKISDGGYYRSSSDYFTSVFPVVMSTTRVADEVSRVLDAISTYSSLELCEDDLDSTGCLSEDDLIYILDDRCEMLHTADWIKIYPSAEEDGWDPSVHTAAGGDRSWRSSYNKHALLRELQVFYKRADRQNREFADRDSTDVYWKYEGMRTPLSDRYTDGDIVRNCTMDNAAYGKITAIHVSQDISMRELSPGQYHANVSYDTIMVKLRATAAHCHCDVRLENKYNTPGPKSVVLGLGETVVRVYIVDKALPEPSVVNVVFVTIRRETRGTTVVDTSSRNGDLVACGLKQQCSLKVNREDRCGLVSLKLPWSKYKSLPWQHCTEGNSPGQWVVPCSKCSDESTCHWKGSRWQPNTCSYRHFSDAALKTCLAGKKLLFIGDSTNRGILNYIIDRINGSLWDWDKTHTIKTYDNVNGNSTFLSFAYYPHFWLPADHRPKFQKIIYQLIKSSLPLENSPRTVLVVGGVQWLATQHIDYIVEALQKKGLSNITVVVKGLGAGFHQPVEGIRFLPASEHAQLLHTEAETLSYARTRGFKVVSTFNITMARYKDFLEGKCACHFHKVTKLNTVQQHKDFSKSPHSEQHHTNTAKGQYSVTGDINAAYSDIVIDQICS